LQAARFSKGFGKGFPRAGRAKRDRASFILIVSLSGKDGSC
jgi:hypothetical protein